MPPHVPEQQFTSLLHAASGSWQVQAPFSQSPVQQSWAPSVQAFPSERQVWHVLGTPRHNMSVPQHSLSPLHVVPLFGQVWQVFAPSGPTHLRLPQHPPSVVQDWPESWQVHVPPSQILPSQQSVSALQLSLNGWQERQVPSGLPMQFIPEQHIESWLQGESSPWQGWQPLSMHVSCCALQHTWAAQ